MISSSHTPPSRRPHELRALSQIHRADQELAQRNLDPIASSTAETPASLTAFRAVGILRVERTNIPISCGRSPCSIQPAIQSQPAGVAGPGRPLGPVPQSSCVIRGGGPCRCRCPRRNLRAFRVPRQYRVRNRRLCSSTIASVQSAPTRAPAIHPDPIRLKLKFETINLQTGANLRRIDAKRGSDDQRVSRRNFAD
jgi:hypothetical protein